MAIESPFGRFLQQTEYREATKNLLASYQENKANNFIQLDRIYNGLEKTTHKQQAFKLVIEHIVEQDYSIVNLDDFVKEVVSCDLSCAQDKVYQNCMDLMLGSLLDRDNG